MINEWALFRKSSISIGVLPKDRVKNGIIEIVSGSLEEACNRAETLEKEMRTEHELQLESRLSAERPKAEAKSATPVERKRRGRPRKSPHLA